MSSSTALPGARIGKYRIVAHVATGGMGAVYKALDEEQDRTVAIKVLSPELAKNPILVERFRREAKHAARLTHKNIVTLLECGQSDGLHYLVMEFVEGMDLADFIRRKGKLKPEEAMRILRQACKALEHAFAQGVTHRDIKPSNFLLAIDDRRCRVKLTDLGLARMNNDEEFRVTRAGTTVGTVDYMAPEQARNSGLADVRSDIYSLGCTFYHMLAGQAPFAEGGIGERIYKHLAADPPDVRTFNPRVSASLWAFLKRMLAKNPDDRFQTPSDVLAALEALTAPAAPSPQQEENPDSDLEAEEDPSPALPEPEEDEPPARTKRKSTLPDLNTVAETPPDALGVTREQRSNAAAQFAHATEVMRTGGDHGYAQQLLLSSCKLDPSNILYRKMLREIGRDVAAGKRGGWLGSLTTLPARGRVRAARNAGDHRKVLECGEELLARLPNDVSTQVDMADAAEALGLTSLAVWLLEEGRQQASKDKTLLRALALLYERQKRYNHAIAAWEQIRQIDPTDTEPGNKIRALSVSDTIARSNFRS